MKASFLPNVLFVLAIMMLAATLFQGHGGAAEPIPDRQTARAALAEIARVERATLDRQGRFTPFGASPAERQAALGPLGVDVPDTLFNFDALADTSERLQIRAISRPDAVRAGRVAPLIEVVFLTVNKEKGSSREMP